MTKDEIRQELLHIELMTMGAMWRASLRAGSTIDRNVCERELRRIASAMGLDLGPLPVATVNAEDH